MLSVIMLNAAMLSVAVPNKSLEQSNSTPCLCLRHVCSLNLFNFRHYEILSTSYNPLIGLYHPQDGVTNPQYKLLHFSTIIFLTKRRKH